MVKTRSILGCLLIAIFGVTAFAQTAGDTGAKLTQAFVGKIVTINIDMPATNKGIDVRAGSIDREKNQKRLKTYGTAIRTGQAVKVTRIEVNGNEISFELAGGGAADIDLTSLLGPKPEGTTSNIQESRARSRVNAASSGKIDTGRVNSDLRYMSAERKRSDAERTANYETRKQNAIEKYRQGALQQGSRFIIKIDDAPVTPDKLMKTLATYVAF